MSKRPLFLFDWDLTLVDSELQKIFVFSRAILGNPRALIFLPKLKNIFHMNVIDFVRICGSSKSDAESLRVYHRECNRFSNLVKFKGLKVLKFLKKNGYRVGIITNDYSLNVFHILKKYGVRVDYVADTTKTREKPFPDSILLALKHFGVSPNNAYYIGDSPTDIIAGRRANVHTVALKTLYYSSGALRKVRPERIINNINDVLKITKNTKTRRAKARVGS